MQSRTVLWKGWKTLGKWRVVSCYSFLMTNLLKQIWKCNNVHIDILLWYSKKCYTDFVWNWLCYEIFGSWNISEPKLVIITFYFFTIINFTCFKNGLWGQCKYVPSSAQIGATFRRGAEKGWYTSNPVQALTCQTR